MPPRSTLSVIFLSVPLVHLFAPKSANGAWFFLIGIVKHRFHLRINELQFLDRPKLPLFHHPRPPRPFCYLLVRSLTCIWIIMYFCTHTHTHSKDMRSIINDIAFMYNSLYFFSVCIARRLSDKGLINQFFFAVVAAVYI